MITLYNRHPHIIHCISILILIAVLFCKVSGHEFLINWDDVDYITQNPLIRDITVANLKQIFFYPFYSVYAPLHILSYMFDYAIWGLNPAAFKIINVVMHAACAIVFYHLLLRLHLNDIQAFIATLLFSIHPVQVESVVWASERKSMLSLLFFLGAWFAWDIWNRDDVRNRYRWYLFSLACFTLSLISKPITVILPCILIAQELFLNDKKITINTMKPMIPYMLLSGGFILLLLTTAKGAGGGTVPYHGGSFGISAMNMIPVFSRYLWLLVMPTNLCLIYNAPLKSSPDSAILVYALILLLFIITWLWLGKRKPVYFFWLSIYIVGLLPVSNIIPIVTLMNDRYLYYPMLGIAPFMVLAGSDALKFFKIRNALLPVILSMLVITFLSVLTWQRVDVWKNSLTLWKDTMTKAPPGTWYETSTNTNFIKEGYVEALIVEATRLNSEGRLDEAQQHCLTALSFAPDDYNALGLLAGIYMENNKPLEARPYLLQLVKNYSGSEAAHLYLGVNYGMTGEKERAAEQFRIVIRINPKNQRALQGLNDVMSTPVFEISTEK